MQFFFITAKNIFPSPIRHVSKTNKFTFLYRSSVLSLFINCQLGNIFKNLKCLHIDGNSRIFNDSACYLKNKYLTLSLLLSVVWTAWTAFWKKKSPTDNTDHNHSVRLEENWYTDSVLLLLANKYPQPLPQPNRHVPNTTKFTFVYFLFRFL